MKILMKTTYLYDVDSEAESEQLIQGFKDNQLKESYIVTKSKVDHKIKKDRKTGEIEDERWLTEVTLSYEV